MAGGAVLQECLLVVRSGHAREPLGAGELRCDIIGLVQLDIDAGGLARRNIHSRPFGRNIAGGADPDAVMAGFQTIRRERVMALIVAHD